VEDTRAEETDTDDIDDTSVEEAGWADLHAARSVIAAMEALVVMG
jgi:hypothetical protein